MLLIVKLTPEGRQNRPLMVIYVLSLVVPHGLQVPLGSALKMRKPGEFALAFILSAKGIVELTAYTFMSDVKVLSLEAFQARLIFVTISSEDNEADWETILDSKVLKYARSSDYISYIKHFINDGHETVNIVHSIVDDFDLIIVGKRYNIEDPQTSGLKEWSELPEIGIMGDLLASKDLTGKFSVLVVQQQHII
ncbi:hypothetical protein Patl1_34875 [Pistacia atlantica]|uniref:Uncharacterized protein n=1 Tax=Pistacia atlantica TaxID=434234 RepID=A0ACC0ZQY0_9ROSI|nr:hypothetical protein Patl1_34875 [Pistacia atlantica]